MFKRTIFTRMMLVVMLFLIPAILLYVYSNRTSVNVVEGLIHDTSSKQLAFLSKQVDNGVNQLSDFAVNMSQDPNVREFMGYSFVRSDYEDVRLRASIMEKLELNALSSTWPSRSVVYSLYGRRALSNSALFDYDPMELELKLKLALGQTWSLRRDPNNSSYFYYYATVPAVYSKFDQLHAVVEIRFPLVNIQNMLDQFELASNGKVFLYNPDGRQFITGKQNTRENLSELLNLLNATQLNESGNIRANTTKTAYELYYELVPSLGWYIVEYVPVEMILQPIRINQRNFLITMVLLLAVGVGLILLLYRNVQYPILKLIRNIERVKQGDYVVTLVASTRNDEFQYLFNRFNDMTMQIRQLIERVYEERLRSRDATLKQLQSQINPHFLYNCLSFIMNMTKLKKHEDVVMMTYHLSQYYRYVTRVETETVSISQEMEFTRHYLSITQLRFVQIEMEYDIPDEVKAVNIPKLLIQPIVENAIKYGIERTGEPVRIKVAAYVTGRHISIVIEDNGEGMPLHELAKMMERMKEPFEDDEIGTGLRNVQRRLSMHFGEHAGVELSQSDELGGLKVELYGINFGSEEENIA